ncbi:MAG: mRNA surveillance protein pelota [Candidatus Aenigmarchaeota archaeon]|nr:mRNA surveillance protein pelota [Candidatus Aenigmarchaeota archaeon]
MKTVKKDLRNGLVVLKMETPEDLWHLERILRPGDMIKTRTMRKVSVKAGGEYKMSEKKPMVLAVEMEKMSFDATTGALRVAGKITEGPEDTKLSSYHTMEIEPGNVITVTKSHWHSSDFDRIRESAERQPSILICVLDRDEADIAMLKGTGIHNIAHIDSENPEDKEPYRKEVAKFLAGQDGYDVMIVAGPGFEAGNVVKVMKNAYPEVKPVLEGASHTGPNGINEVIKRSADRVLRDTRIGRESMIVGDILARIKMDGLIAYGKEETRKALEMGAVETLVVSREKINEYEELMALCEKMKGSVKMITADHETGEQFLHIGGIAGLLRFRLEY